MTPHEDLAARLSDQAGAALVRRCFLEDWPEWMHDNSYQSLLRAELAAEPLPCVWGVPTPRGHNVAKAFLERHPDRLRAVARRFGDVGLSQLLARTVARGEQPDGTGGKDPRLKAQAVRDGHHRFGRMLQDLRVDREITLGTAARHAGVAVSVLSSVEHSRARASVEVVRLLADLYGVPFTVFFDAWEAEAPPGTERTPAPTTELALALDEHDALLLAVGAARLSPCAKSKRGVVVWAAGRPPVTAFNGPPPGFACDGSEDCRRACGKLCVHAEVRALVRADAGCTDLLHVKVVDGEPVPSGPPSCADCSKVILDRGLERVWLLHDAGLRSYSAKAFHLQSLVNRELPVVLPHPERPEEST